MSHLPRVEITCVSPRDYPVNLARWLARSLVLVRANTSTSTPTIDSDFSVIADSEYYPGLSSRVCTEVSGLLFTIYYVASMISCNVKK